MPKLNQSGKFQVLSFNSLEAPGLRRRSGQTDNEVALKGRGYLVSLLNASNEN